MKTHLSSYGSLKLSVRQTRGLQLEWDMVETPAAMPRFLNFPCCEVPARTQRRTRRVEKRPLAA